MKLRILLVGCGEMGLGHHLPSLLRVGAQVALVGCVRRTRCPIEQLPNLPIFTDITTPVQTLKPELVVISAPHAFHAAQVRFALENGCHVFVEKPLALEFDDAKQLARLAEARAKLLVVGLQRRYEGFCSIVRGAKAAGRLGDVLFAHGLFSHMFETGSPTGWRADPQLAGAGILDDSAYHVLDVLLSCTGGKIKHLVGAKVLAECDGPPHSFSAVFEMDNGGTVTASGSYLAPRQSVQEEFSLLGTKGSLFARRFCRDWNTAPPSVFFKSRDGFEKEDFDLSGRPSGRGLPLETMVAVLLGSKPRTELLTEAEDTLETHRAVALIRDSAGLGVSS